MPHNHVRIKVIKGVIDWLDDVLVHDLDYNDVTNKKSFIVAPFHAISILHKTMLKMRVFYSRYIYNDDIEEYPPVPVTHT